MSKDDMNRLNPLIREATIGVRELRSIKLYPLSMADQLSLSAILVKTIQEIYTKREEDNIVFAASIQTAISENLGKILTFVTDEGEILLKEISNEQALEISEMIYDMNYGILEKKVKSLIEKIRKTFQSPTSLPQSSENTVNTDLKTSLEKVTEKEESPLDK
jgi:hypothetical protein